MTTRSVALAALLLVAACTSEQATPDTTEPGTPTTAASSVPGTAATPTTTGEAAVLDLDPERRTTARITSLGAFDALAKQGVGGHSVTKFSITDFLGAAAVEWLDSDFYTLHDEWYWFQLLNGRRVDGFDVEPIDGLELDTVEAAYEWAEENRTSLPLDLRFTSLGRLYSPSFYAAALDDPTIRPVALGSVIRVPAREETDEPERWLLELEYRDGASPVQVARYFDLLIDALPDTIGEQLAWVPRSREQEIVAERMERDGLAYGDRTIRYDDLVQPGDTEVYSAGIAAGRLLLVTDDSRYSLSDAGPNDVVVVQRTPDALPPGNALLTGTPQTPLAHVNVLALNRGIPNAFLGGLTDNAELSQLGRVRAPVAIRAVAPDQLDIRALTDDEFDEWKRRRGRAAISVPPVDVSTMSLLEPLNVLAGGNPSENDIASLRPIIGGKAAGFLGLSAPGTVTMPDRPIAITVRPYFEHIRRLGGVVEAMVTSPEFTSDAQFRFLLLEGRADHDEVYASDDDQSDIEQFIADHPSGSPLGDIVAAGGIKQMIRDLPVAPETLTALQSELAEHFTGYSPTQGLRFRSSSSVEDIEGFNGAGLYSSNTGYLDPTVLPDEDDHKRTIARAITRTWSSYWNAEAVEERRFESVDHLSGGMGVLVHARFDDDLEVSNGVATFTVQPEGSGLLRLNVQTGATSVTNPDNEPGQAPEIVEMIGIDAATAKVTRIGQSTLNDGDVLSDAKLREIFAQLDDVTRSWLARTNSSVATGQESSTLTLDFEFREMATGWPALTPGAEPFPERIVIKQARSIEPGLRQILPSIRTHPVPRDVLARTIRIERLNCPGASEEVDDQTIELFEYWTDPLASVDLGYSEEPLLRWREVGATGTYGPLQATTPPGGIDRAACSAEVILRTSTDYLLTLFADRDASDS